MCLEEAHSRKEAKTNGEQGTLAAEEKKVIFRHCVVMGEECLDNGCTQNKDLKIG